MGTTTTQRSDSPSTGATKVVDFVRRHPVASFLVLGHVGLWMSLLPVIAWGANIRLMSAVGALVGLTLPAFLVTAATDGRRGVNDLLRRTLHWRVGTGWYVLALVTLPIATAAAAPLLTGTTVGAVAQQSGTLISAFLAEVGLALVTVQLFEEIGWTGFAQHRVQARRGPLKASLLLGLAFATIHFPTIFVGKSLTTATLSMAVAQTVAIIPVAIMFRTFIAWIYNRTAFSVILAAIVHAAFNAVGTDAFLNPFGPERAAMMLPVVAVVGVGLLVSIATRGRLGFRRQATGNAELLVS